MLVEQFGRSQRTCTSNFRICSMVQADQKLSTPSEMTIKTQLAKSALSVTIQHLSVWRRSSPSEATCFFKTDAQFVNTLHISEWSVLKSQLMRWDSHLLTIRRVSIWTVLSLLLLYCRSKTRSAQYWCCWIGCIHMDGNHIDAGVRESVDGFGSLMHRCAPTHDGLKNRFGLYKFIINSRYRTKQLYNEYQWNWSQTQRSGMLTI